MIIHPFKKKSFRKFRRIYGKNPQLKFINISAKLIGKNKDFRLKFKVRGNLLYNALK